tara:strand:+ start:519 stop:1541 length:1023 start_codon:yes stop_codon:yes gene_type:complete
MFDIIIPIWKMKTKYLEVCLQSILAQTEQDNRTPYTKYKCYIIDGTPMDWKHYETQQRMLKKLIGKNKRFEYHRHQNSDKPFVSEAFNQGRKLGSNPYLQFVGGDDFFYQTYFSMMEQRVMSESDRKSVGISFCMVQKNEKSVVDLGDIKLGVVETYLLNHYMALPFLKEELLRYFHVGSPVLMNGAVFLRTAFEEVGGYDEDMVIYEDTDLVLRIIKAGYLSRWYAFVGSYLRVHNEQTTLDGEVPYDRKLEFKRSKESYENRHIDERLYLKTPEEIKNIVRNKFGEDIDNSLAESIFGMTYPGAWKDLSARFIREKLQFFVLKNEDEVNMFMEGDIVL